MKVAPAASMLLLAFSPVEAVEINELINIYGSLRQEIIFRTPEAKETIRVMDD